MLERAVLCTNKMCWLRVSPNLLDFNPDVDGKIKLFHSEFFLDHIINLTARSQLSSFTNPTLRILKKIHFIQDKNISVIHDDLYLNNWISLFALVMQTTEPR